MKTPTRITQQLLNNLTIRCQNHVDGCHLQCKLEYIQQLTQHEQQWCQAANNEKKREINDLKKKIMELQDALSVQQGAINDKDKLIMEHEETLSHLIDEKLIDKNNSTMESSSFPPSAPPVELLESTSITLRCSELVNQDSLEGINSCIFVYIYKFIYI